MTDPGDHTAAPPSIDLRVDYERHGLAGIHVSVPVTPYAQDDEGFIRPTYVHDLIRGLAATFGIAFSGVAALETITEAPRPTRGTVGAGEGTMPCGCAS